MCLGPPIFFSIFQGKDYAGVQFSTACFCGDSYGAQGEATESDCNMQCSGNANQMCGGPSRNSVYKTG